MNEEILKQFIIDSQRKEQKHIVDEIVNNQIKIISVLYDKAITYTQLIVIAGYASFFGIWAFVKEYVSVACVLWSAIFMSISVIIFVFFEVCKMIFNSWFLLRRDNVLNKVQFMNEPQQILNTFREHDKQTQKYTVKWGKFWCWTIVPTVLSAVIAIVIALVGFIDGLISING